jgi:hypothetical protein
VKSFWYSISTTAVCLGSTGTGAPFLGEDALRTLTAMIARRRSADGRNRSAR